MRQHETGDECWRRWVSKPPLLKKKKRENSAPTVSTVYHRPSHTFQFKNETNSETE